MGLWLLQRATRALWPVLALACLAAPHGVRAETLAAISGAAAALGLAVAEAPAADTTLDGDKNRTRFVIGLDRPAKYQIFSLSRPNRVIVDISDPTVRLPELAGDTPVGLIKTFRGGLSAPGRARVVIEVTDPVVVESSRIEKGKDGHRLTLDFVPAVAKAGSAPFKDAPYALGAAGLQPPLPLPAVRPDVRAAGAFKPVIVIDPGHGGHDSGAMKNGTVEKDVVLAFAKVLRQKLESTGQYKIIMTRETDVFVELAERLAFAKRHNANLFIAVHADYASTKARGATIYSLRQSVAGELSRSARNEVGDNVLSTNEVTAVKQASGDVDAVRSILSDLAQREVGVTRERTSVFARSVIEYMGARTNMRDDPDQEASFRVLRTAHFPSVLIELAYVSNKEDAQLLKSNTWRDTVAGSIVTAVDNYFSHQLARLPM